MSQSTDPIQIRRAESITDYLACQDAQRRAWGIVDDSYVVPVATMVGAQHHGGLVLGAFLPNGEAVGMSFAFLGRTEGQLCLYSQLTGIVPGYQDRGIGHQLKTRQREIARDEQVPTIAWAFDPLQSGNARFNLDKLGATAGRFLINMYGLRTDALNRNTPTDRLIAVWDTEPQPPRAAIPVDNLPRLIASEPTPRFHGMPEAVGPCLLEIPGDVNRLRADDRELAEAWTLAVREAFLAAFAAGYRATGFARIETEDGRRGYYVLTPPNGSTIHAE